MSEHLPKVSIGLAVYNGERYLKEAIDSILAQTFTDFELIISDNASTDSTGDICREYASRDSRIRYHRNPQNIGGVNNENQTFHMSKGEYFRLAADDDICAPTLIEECVKALDQNPTAVLSYSQTVDINEHGEETGKSVIGKADSQKAYKRFISIALDRDSCEQTYGLIRSNVLKQTQLQQNYTNSDRVFLAELSLYGEFYEIPEYLFYKRFHQKNVYVNWRTRMAWFDPSLKGKIVFPWWMQLSGYFKVIRRTPVSFYDKLRCYLFMIGWMFLFGKNLIKDLLVAVYMLLHTYEWRKQLYENTNNWS